MGRWVGGGPGRLREGSGGSTTSSPILKADDMTCEAGDSQDVPTSWGSPATYVITQPFSSAGQGAGTMWYSELPALMWGSVNTAMGHCKYECPAGWRTDISGSMTGYGFRAQGRAALVSRPWYVKDMKELYV